MENLRNGGPKSPLYAYIVKNMQSLIVRYNQCSGAAVCVSTKL